MEKIVKVHFPNIQHNLLNEALKTFYALRQIDEFRKKPSTSELIDWIQAIIAGGIPSQKISKDIPFLGTLLKKETDIDYFLTRYMNRMPLDRIQLR
jgi:MoxR-like ATPase